MEKYLEIRCDASYNESDEELAKKRKEWADSCGYDAEMWFSIFYEQYCLRCCFRLHGLDVNCLYRYHGEEDDLDAVLAITKTAVRWFDNYKIEDIGEAFYKKVETELKDEIVKSLENIKGNKGE